MDGEWFYVEHLEVCVTFDPFYDSWGFVIYDGDSALTWSFGYDSMYDATGEGECQAREDCLSVLLDN